MSNPPPAKTKVGVECLINGKWSEGAGTPVIFAQKGELYSINADLAETLGEAEDKDGKSRPLARLLDQDEEESRVEEEEERAAAPVTSKKKKGRRGSRGNAGEPDPLK